MAKILRLHKESNDNITDWGLSKRYGKDVINQITDPTGADAKKEITSIPSPFARIDLAKNAFKWVVDSNDLEGKTIHHKMVSDCLDVAELFFNYDKFSDKLEILVWDKDQEIAELKKSRNEEHRILGASLEMYLEQDAATYNFQDFDRIYLLNYIGPDKPAQMNIIGATSPATLFVSSSNNLRYSSIHLKSNGQDLPFDDDYSPLYQRDFAFQKYFYALRASFGDAKFAQYFPELDAYLLECYRHLTDDQKKTIDALKDDSIQQFEELSIKGNTVEVLGIHLCKNTAFVGDQLVSDFIIKSDKYVGVKPLVLPFQKGNDYITLRYVQDNWSKDYEAPIYDDRKLNERILPNTSEKYPYLTIGDFLEPVIVSMPYEMTDHFFNGNNKDKKTSYLIPLTDRFFEFFTVEDLMGNVATNKKMFEIRSSINGSAEVTLRIPIQKNRYIEYSRIYYTKVEPDLMANKGSAIEKRFGLGVLPLVAFEQGLKPFYRIAFFSEENGSQLIFKNSNEEVEIKSHIIRRNFKPNCSIESYVLEDRFDHIGLDLGPCKNYIIPIFKTVGNATQFTFAVDFGTTNTHVEYSLDGSKNSKSFNIGKEEQQMQRLHKDYGEEIDIKSAFDETFIPNTIGDGDMYSFPIRTALAENVNIDYKKQTNSMADANIPFRFEKAGLPYPPFYKVRTDIKWSNNERGRVTLYLDNLFFLLRNKVLLNNGDLAATKVIWFYPLSMTKSRFNEFKAIWQSLYNKYFGDNLNNLIVLSESIAPYYYYKAKKGLKSNAITIDVGGGTTDVFVVDNNVPQILTSFRFASNSIFGDGYNFSVEDNGFVNTFKDRLKSHLESNQKEMGVRDILNAFESISNLENSSDIIAFFFSIASNKVIQEKNIPIDFLQMLADEEKLKYVFIIFYGALLYHVAKLMKAKGLHMPQTLAFSGNGSRTLYVLSNEKDTLALFASLIFEKVYGEKYVSDKLEVILDNEPKLATCKGGVASRIEDFKFEEVDGLKSSLLGTDDTTFAEGVKYKDLTDDVLNKVANSVAEFIDFIFSLDSENKNFYLNYFNADRRFMTKAKDICLHGLLEYAKQGLAKKKEELESWGLNEESEVEETLFFYPLVPILNLLGSKL